MCLSHCKRFRIQIYSSSEIMSPNALCTFFIVYLSVRANGLQVQPDVDTELSIIETPMMDIHNVSEATTKNVKEVTTNKVMEVTKNEGPTFLKTVKRRVLIISNNSTVDTSVLRSSKKKSTKITSLLYVEYNDNGEKENEFMMYNLEDVATFFKTFLNVAMCTEEC